MSYRTDSTALAVLVTTTKISYFALLDLLDTCVISYPFFAEHRAFERRQFLDQLENINVD